MAQGPDDKLRNAGVDVRSKQCAQALGTDEISVHGIFNARPMMPGGHPTPWHQDAQYWRAHGAEVA